MTSDVILIIEDNEQNLKLARDVLQHHGYRTLEARSAEGGLALASAELPDLILMDIHLPGMDGFAALRRLRGDERTRRIPVIAVTASVMDEQQQHIRDAGFDDLQKKPIQIREFVEAVRTVLARSNPEATP